MGSPPKRRQLGAYYTPDDVARLIVTWALDGKPGRIMDPTFGGCSFLRASYEELKELGERKPGELIFGVDLDEEVVSYREELIKLGVPSSNLLLGNFFDVSPESFGRFRAVVGNPPYVRHHWFGGADRYRALDAISTNQFELSSLSSSWAYFLLHAVQFLETGGRLGLLLPSSLLYTGYARGLVQMLSQNFANCRLVRLRERLFESAVEQTVFVLAEGRGEGSCAPTVTEAETLKDFSRLLDGSWTPAVSPFDGWRLGSLPKSAQKLWTSIIEDEETYSLGQVADIKIGVVTGANDFFVRRVDDQLGMRNGISLQPVVTTSRWLNALSWRRSDHSKKEELGIGSRLLVVDSSIRVRGQLQKELESASEKGIPTRVHCEKRERWFALEDVLAPDAFLPYMSVNPRSLVLNRAGATCTNAIHRVYWKDSFYESKKAIVAASWTSLFSLGAELVGRAYGGGVIKLEPSEARQLPVPYYSEAKSVAREIDYFARNGETLRATRVADEAILMSGMGLTESEVRTLKRATKTLAQRRRPLKSSR